MLKSFRQMSFCNRNMFVSFGEKMQTLRLVFFCIKIIDLRSFEGKLCIGNSFSSYMSAIHVISRMSRSMLTARNISKMIFHLLDLFGIPFQTSTVVRYHKTVINYFYNSHLIST